MEIEMDPSTAQFHNQHHQEMSSQSQTLESMLVCNKAAQEKKPRPPDQAALKCPRCDSANTKFCYYNNYSLTQPRYFCKSCRRYWTKGGTLRNVPVGGGCRKSNKRPSSSSSNSTSPTSSSSSKRAHDHLHHHQPLLITSSNPNPLLTHLHPNYHHDSTTTDLSLAFARLQSQANAGFDHDFLASSQNTPHPHDNFLATNTNSTHHHHSFLDAIRGGFLESGTSSTGGFHSVYPFGDHLGNAENNGGILGLNNVSHEDQMGMNPYHHHHHHHQEEDMAAATSGAATTAVTVTTVKQESCNARDVGESRVLWGFPWQIGGDQGNVAEVDSGRQIGNWNGFGSTWHGLLNSPLM